MNKIKQSILAIVIGLALAAGVSWAQIYKDPTCNPPNCNTPTPINVGIENQQKGGGVFFTSPFGGINVNGAANFGGLTQFNQSTTFNNYPAIFKAGIVIPTNAGEGRVLTSDSSGNASWKSPQSSISFKKGQEKMNVGCSSNWRSKTIDVGSPITFVYVAMGQGGWAGGGWSFQRTRVGSFSGNTFVLEFYSNGRDKNDCDDMVVNWFAVVTQ